VRGVAPSNDRLTPDFGWLALRLCETDSVFTLLSSGEDFTKR